MYCNACGKAIPDDVRVCSYCGKPLAGASRPTLVRPRHGRAIAGVCAGVAQHFGWSVTAVRLIWILSVVFAGFGVLPYVILWIVMPNEG